MNSKMSPLDEDEGFRFSSRDRSMQIIRLGSSSNINSGGISVDKTDPEPISATTSILSKEAATAPIDFPTSQRIWSLPPAIAIHLSIGSVYVYSMWTPGMAKALGTSSLLFHALQSRNDQYLSTLVSKT